MERVRCDEGWKCRFEAQKAAVGSLDVVGLRINEGAALPKLLAEGVTAAIFLETLFNLSFCRWNHGPTNICVASRKYR